MGEVGCLKDGNFQNLQVGGTTELNNTSMTGFVDGTATATLLASQSGQTIAVGAAAAGLVAHSTFTLPTVSKGLYYRFAYFGGATDAQNLLIQASPNTVGILGGVGWHDHNTDSTAEPALVYSAVTTNDLFTIAAPAAGTAFELVCDGASWFMNGFVVAGTTPAFSDGS
tara:strand:+ start:15 stop:521 length:507 start_codon:yes stop_codon:yes gene_type:complete